MTDPIKQLRALEAALEKAKLENASLTGKKESIMQELEETFEVKTITEAENLLEEYEEEVTRLSTEISTMIAEVNKILSVR